MARGSSERLRASPNFALALTMDGRPYVAKDSEPYIQYWLSERERVLLGLFGARRGVTEDAAIEGYLRMTGETGAAASRQRLARAIAGMREAGVLIGARDDVSRYDKDIVEAYLTHRPFPPEITARIVADAPVTTASRVLDLAGGPGDFAVQLAAKAGAVALMELSRGFLDAAQRRAVAAGQTLELLHESCNRLVFRDDSFDVITVAQALHWLDDVMVCRGVGRVLRPGGSFFVVHGAMTLPEAHPLAWLFGAHSILGAKTPVPFAEEVAALRRRLALLFEALDTPGVDRIDLARRGGTAPCLRPVRSTLFRQTRPIGLGFARGFLTPAHVAQSGLAPDVFWARVEADCAAATPAQLAATSDFALLQFSRDGAAADAVLGSIALGYGGPASG